MDGKSGQAGRWMRLPGWFALGRSTLQRQPNRSSCRQSDRSCGLGEWRRYRARTAPSPIQRRPARRTLDPVGASQGQGRRSAAGGPRDAQRGQAGFPKAWKMNAMRLPSLGNAWRIIAAPSFFMPVARDPNVPRHVRNISHKGVGVNVTKWAMAVFLGVALACATTWMPSSRGGFDFNGTATYATPNHRRGAEGAERTGPSMGPRFMSRGIADGSPSRSRPSWLQWGRGL